jgi:uroporphyrinogen-III synthase
MKRIYLLSPQEFEDVINFPIIKINFLSPSFSLENIDYLLFTSKNGVKAFKNLVEKWPDIPALAIGDATAKEIEKNGGKVVYKSKTGYGDEFAKEINEKFKNKTFLFPRAKIIVSNIKEFFKENKLIELIVYETVCNEPDKKLQKPAVVIFTSPSTVKCFAKKYSFSDIVPVAIGKKTKNELEKYTDKTIILPSKPSIKECIKIAKNVKI